MDTTNHGAERPHDPNVGHETTDVNLELVDRVGIGLAVALVLSMLAAWGVFRFLQNREVAGDPPPRPVTAIEAPGALSPILQTNEPEDLGRFRAAEDRALHSYGWVDRDAGVVQIPIDLAIDLVSERGLPAAAPTASTLAAPVAVGQAEDGVAGAAGTSADDEAEARGQEPSAPPENR